MKDEQKLNFYIYVLCTPLPQPVKILAVGPCASLWCTDPPPALSYFCALAHVKQSWWLGFHYALWHVTDVCPSSM